MRVLALALGLVSCGRYGFDELGIVTTDDAAQVDAAHAAPSDAALAMADAQARDATATDASTCTDENFAATPMPCAPWGHSFANGATIAQGDGQLSISATDVNTNAGCTTLAMVSLGSAGATAKFSQVPTATDAYITLQVNQIDRQLSVTNGMLVFTTLDFTQLFAAVPYDASAMQWLNLHEVSGGIVAQYSADGTAWTPLATQSLEVTPSLINLLAGLADQAAPITAAFGHFSTCPSAVAAP